MARIRTSIWDDLDWRALTSSGQLYALTCMAFRQRGNPSKRRIQQLTGWSAEFIDQACAEVAASPYAWVLTRAYRRKRLPRAVRQEVFERDGKVCAHCGATEALTIDHIFPFSLGGSDHPANLQVLCQPCNSIKGVKV